MKLRVGVVGVGPAWESRHLPALRALSDRFEVRAVCDPVQHRAKQVAQQFNASVHDGFRLLSSREDIDSILQLSARFYGTTPIYAACDQGKAVYCAAAIDMDDAESTALHQRVKESGIAFMAEFPCRLSPATLRLKELIATKLGEPRLLFCNRRKISPPNREGSDRCMHDLVELIDWCRFVIKPEPSSVFATAHQVPSHLHKSPSQNPLGGPQRPEKFEGPSGFGMCSKDYLSVTLDCSPEGETGTGPLAVIGCGDYVPKSLEESLAYRRPADLKVVCERGIAFVDLPHTVAWFDEAGQHLETLDHERPVGELLLLHFHRAVESLILKSSNLKDAYRAIVIANQAKLSCQSGKRLSC